MTPDTTKRAEAMRAEFEKWAESKGYDLLRYQYGGEHYEYTETVSAWTGWQAASERQGWRPIETRPPGEYETYLVCNAKGQVAPIVRGVIQNNVGTAWDWEYGEAITGWQPLPPAPSRAAMRESVHE